MIEKTHLDEFWIVKIVGAIVIPFLAILAATKPFELNARSSVCSICLGMVSLSKTAILKPYHLSSKMGFLKP